MLNDTNSLFIFIINFNSLDLSLPAWWCLAASLQLGVIRTVQIYLEISPSPRSSPLTIKQEKGPWHWPHLFSLLTRNFLLPWHPGFHLHKPVHNPSQWLFSWAIFNLKKPHQPVVSQALSCSFETRTEIKQLFPSYVDNCWCFQRHLGGLINYLWVFSLPSFHSSEAIHEYLISAFF